MYNTETVSLTSEDHIHIISGNENIVEMFEVKIKMNIDFIHKMHIDCFIYLVPV